MVLAVVGGRNFSDYNVLDNAIKEYFCEFDVYAVHGDGYVPKFSKFVSGGAEGADSLGKSWVTKYNSNIDPNLRYYLPIEIKEFLPDWDKFGKNAAFKRNKEIISNCDALLAFWDGNSAGTQNSIAYAKKMKKDTIIIYY